MQIGDKTTIAGIVFSAVTALGTVAMPQYFWSSNEWLRVVVLVFCAAIGICCIVYLCYLHINWKRRSIKWGLLAGFLVSVGIVVIWVAPAYLWSDSNFDYSVPPLAWEKSVGITATGGGDSLVVNAMIISAINTSMREVPFEEAHIRSLINGYDQLMNAHTSAGEMPSNQINPIPPGSRLVLVVTCDLPVSQFQGRWAHLSFVARYDGKIYQNIFNPGKTIERLVEQTGPHREAIPEPRITPRLPR